jgi:hypothetical protein
MDRQGKKDMRGTLITLFLGVLTILAVVAFAMFAGFGGIAAKSIGGSGSTVTNSEGQQQLLTCESSTTPDLDIDSFDFYNPGTALTEGTNLFRKSGSTAWTAWTAGTAITNLEVGKEYEFVMGIGTTDFTDNAYGPYFKHTVLCQESELLNKAVYNDEVETSITATFYNADDVAATAEVFSAGQTQEISTKWVAGTDEVFGNPFIAESSLPGLSSNRREYPNVLCLDLNSTAWDAPEKVSYQGVELKRVAAPTRHAPVAAKIAYCYEAPIITDSSDKIKIRANADDSAAPAVDDTAYLYAAHFFLNADDGQIYWGVENEEGAAVGTDASDSLTLDFT